MLQKYLQLFERAFEKLTSLGGSNSTWSDYFTTVGTEFLVLLLGIVYIAAILAIIFIPIFGNRKVVQKIAKNDAYKKARKLGTKWYEFRNRIRYIVGNIETNGYKYTADPDLDDEFSGYKYDADLDAELKNSLNEYNITKYTSFIKNEASDKKKKFDKKAINEMMKEQHLDWLSWNENKGDWTACGDFKELGKIDDYGKLCRKFFAKCIAACSAIMIVYAIFVIPLVLMLFK